MTRYVALLRGVNVGGVTMKMGDLAEAVRGLGYADVVTVLASGNVVFTTDDPAATATERLGAALRDRFGYESWMLVLPVDEVRAVVAAYPFERGRDGWHDYVIFAAESEARERLRDVPLDPDLERAALGDGIVYWTVRKGGTIDSALGRAQAAPRVKQRLTARNVNTLERICR